MNCFPRRGVIQVGKVLLGVSGFPKVTADEYLTFRGLCIVIYSYNKNLAQNRTSSIPK